MGCEWWYSSRRHAPDGPPERDAFEAVRRKYSPSRSVNSPDERWLRFRTE